MNFDSGLLAPVRAAVPMERLVSDDAWIEAMLEAELALSRAQARMGIIPTDASERIATAIAAHRFTARAIAVSARAAANPVVGFVEELHRTVANADPVAADYLHYGSTSQDILDTAAMLIAGRALALIVSDLNEVLDALARLANEHRRTLTAARTLAMHAVPTTLGARVACWMQGLLDARDRLLAVRSALPVQLGGAAGNFASYVECARSIEADPEYIYDTLTAEFAIEVGLAVPDAPWHTVRTPIADLAAVSATTAGALGKLAVDVISQSRTEIAELSEPAAPGRGASSAMPQKRNPALSTLIRAAALQVPAHAMTLFMAMHAEDERPAGAWHAEWQPLRECLLLVGGAAHTAVELAAGLTADTDRLRHNVNLTRGQVVSERLAIRLTPLLGRSTAKKALQAAAFDAYATGRPFADVLAEDATVRAHLTEQQITDLLRPENYVGVAPQLVDRVLDRR